MFGIYMRMHSSVRSACRLLLYHLTRSRGHKVSSTVIGMMNGCAFSSTICHADCCLPGHLPAAVGVKRGPDQDLDPGHLLQQGLSRIHEQVWQLHEQAWCPPCSGESFVPSTLQSLSALQWSLLEISVQTITCDRASSEPMIKFGGSMIKFGVPRVRGSSLTGLARCVTWPESSLFCTYCSHSMPSPERVLCQA